MFLFPFPLKVLAVLAVAAAVFYSGWAVRGWKAADERQAELTGYIAAVKQGIARDRQLNGEIERVRAQAAEQREQDRIRFKRELRHASVKPMVQFQCPDSTRDLAQPADTGAAAADPPRVRFTPDFVSLWDDALGIGATEAERARRADAPSVGSDLPEPQDALDNLSENADRWAEDRARLRGLQAWVCRNGFAAEAQCVDVGK